LFFVLFILDKKHKIIYIILFPVVDGCTFKEDVVSSKPKFDSTKGRIHLAEQLAKILPKLMGYVQSNRDLEFIMKTDEAPFRVIFTWTHKGRRPNSRWQGKILAKFTELLDGTNLFMRPDNTGPKGEYIIDLLVKDYDGILIRCENDIVVHKFNDLTQRR
jgi:hypothetical protein